MKREEKILLAVFMAVLICVLGVGLSFALRERTAKIEFKTAQFDKDGSLSLDYSENSPSGTTLENIETVDGVETGHGSSWGNSWFGFGSLGSGMSQTVFDTNEFSQPLPSLMVQTDRSYILKLNERLVIYDFTNKIGKRYQAEFRLQPHP